MVEDRDAPESVDQVAYPQVGLSGPAAALIANLYSISKDLEFARICAIRYADDSLPEGKSADDAIVRQSLWHSAAIAYRRAFGTGKSLIVSKASRPRLSERLVFALLDDRREAHRQVLEMANQHIAHRVGDHEGAAVVAFLAAPPADPEVIGVGWLSARMVGPTVEVARALGEICELLLGLLAAELDQHSEHLLTELKANADLDGLYRAVTSHDGGVQER